MSEYDGEQPVTDLIYYYDPVPVSDREPKPLGVEQGWIVLWDGEPGPAHIAKAGMIHEGDGTYHVAQIDDFKECDVVDDS